MTETTAKTHRWSIIVADGEGDTKTVEENENTHLDQLLRAGLKALLGEHAVISEYDLVIGGTVQEDLHKTLAAAGLHDRSEVVIMRKDVSRG